MLTGHATPPLMKKILVWDLPTRLFHWMFAGLLTVSLLVALVVDEDHPWFQWHALCGLAAASLLVLRIGLGLAGSRHSRFSGFPLRPGAIARYAAGVFTGTARRYSGLNPGAAVAAVLMFTLVPALVLTGIGWGGESLEDLHGALAYSLMAVIGLHLAGLAAHTLRHRENIAASMITGRRAGPAEDGIPSSHPVWGMAFLIAGVLWTAGLFTRHDARAATTRLPLVGSVVPLGEGASQGEPHEGRKTARREHDDD